MIFLPREPTEVLHGGEALRRLWEEEDGQGPLVQLGQGTELRDRRFGVADFPGLDPLHGHVGTASRLFERHADVDPSPLQDLRCDGSKFGGHGLRRC
jgi:hypothetical protein